MSMSIIFGLTVVNLSVSSLPINHCNMASTCIHDGRGVCASSPDGCSRKSFLDQCDMYEYNCDYGTQYMTKVTSPCTSGYQETYILFCGTFLTPTQISQIHSIVTENPRSNEIKNIKSTLKQLTIMITKNDKNESQVYKTGNVIKANNISSLLSTKEALIIKHNSKEVSNKIDNKQNVNFTNVTESNQITNSHENGKNIKSNTINKDNIKSEGIEIVGNTESDIPLEGTQSYSEGVTETIPVYCCDRPLTWVTTTVLTKLFKNIPIETNNLDENIQKTEKSTKYNITDNLIDQTTEIYENENNVTKNKQISGTFNTKLPEIVTNEPLKKITSDMEIVNQTSSVYCCNRPLTWETTTEVTNIFKDVTIENNNSEENKIDKVNENISPNQSMADATDSTNNYTKDTLKHSATLLHVKLYVTEPIQLPWFRKLSNNCNKCQRPLTWLTTTTRRRKYF